MPELLNPSENALEHIRPFISRIEGAPDIQIVGGLGTTALAESGVEIFVDRKEIIVPAHFSLPVIRPDDGTRRDVDVLVKTSNEARLDEVRGILAQEVGDVLERSVFGIRPQEAYKKHMQHDFWRKFASQYVSDRYEVDDEGNLAKAIYPFSVPFNIDTMDNWSMVIRGNEQPIPVPNPAGSIMSYASRSISGVRPKDVVKLQKVATNTFQKAPELRDYILDGPLRSQYELARLLASLRSKDAPIEIDEVIKLTPYSTEEVLAHEGFIAKEESVLHYVKARGLATLKATALHDAESSPSILWLWRKVFEPIAGRIIKNK